MRAAIVPPAQSPKNRSQVYLPPSRRMNTSGHDLETGAGGRHTGDRHHACSPSTHLLDEVRATDGSTGAQSGHTVDLGEGTQHDDVLVLGDKVGAEVIVTRDVRVSFVHQDHG